MIDQKTENFDNRIAELHALFNKKPATRQIHYGNVKGGKKVEKQSKRKNS